MTDAPANAQGALEAHELRVKKLEATHEALLIRIAGVSIQDLKETLADEARHLHLSIAMARSQTEHYQKAVEEERSLQQLLARQAVEQARAERWALLIRGAQEDSRRFCHKQYAEVDGPAEDLAWGNGINDLQARFTKFRVRPLSRTGPVSLSRQLQVIAGALSNPILVLTADGAAVEFFPSGKKSVDRPPWVLRLSTFYCEYYSHQDGESDPVLSMAEVESFLVHRSLVPAMF
jgi:hypothetical protein